jgi:hypothetical protein
MIIGGRKMGDDNILQQYMLNGYNRSFNRVRSVFFLAGE